MEKKRLIDKLIDKIQEYKFIIFKEGGHEYPFDEDEFQEFDAWDILVKYAGKLTEIETVGIFGSALEGNIFTDLARLKNLQTLRIESCSEINEYVYDGLKKLQNLKHLEIVSNRLEKFPDSILQMNNLQALSVLGNPFIKQDFQVEIKQDFLNKTEHILHKINDLSRNENSINTISDRIFSKKKWGLYSDKMLIIIDPRLEKYISVFVIKQSNPNLIFRTLMELFKKVDNTLDCFTKKESGDLKVYTTYRNVDIGYSLSTLKQYQKDGVRKYTDSEHFVDDIIKYIGGKELITEIERERRAEQQKRTLEFERQKNKYIESIEITGFKLFSHLRFDDLSRINVIVGKNGLGKTSLLQAITIGLIPQYSDDLHRGYEKLINHKIIETDNDYYAETHLKWTNFERIQRVYPNLLVQNKELPQTYITLAYGENLFTNEKYEADVYIQHLASGEYKSHSVFSLFQNYCDELPNPLKILDKLVVNNLPDTLSQNVKDELNQIGKLIFRTLNDFLSIKEIKNISIVKQNFKHYFKDINNNLIDLYQISEGYRTNIVLVTDILIRILSARKKLFPKQISINEMFSTVKGTILIDEFDKHLHPAWQRSFLEKLTEILPDIQFFLTTHNLVALQSAEGGKAFILERNEKEQIEIQPKDINLGYSIESIYDEFFDGRQRYFGNKTQELINKFRTIKTKILKNKNFDIMESSEFKQIVERLSSLSNELSVIIEGELGQLKIRKRNAETKANH